MSRVWKGKVDALCSKEFFYGPLFVRCFQLGPFFYGNINNEDKIWPQLNIIMKPSREAIKVTCDVNVQQRMNCVPM